MIRVLFLTTAAGIGVCILCLSVAMAIGGSDLMRNGGWTLGPHVHVDLDGRHHHDNEDVGGPTTSRDLAWDGSTRLEVDAPTDITYTQSAGPAKVTVTGPAGAVKQVSVSHGTIDYDGDDDGPRLQIAVTAPDIESFSLDGDSRLSIHGYDRPSLKLEMDGAAGVDAQGKAGRVDVELSGSGRADLGQVAAQDAHVEISGSGSAALSPKDSADIEISGSGDVTLYGHPARVRSEVTGSGEVRTETGPAPAPATAAAAPTAAPAASAAPAKPAKPPHTAKQAPPPAKPAAPTPAASPAAKTAT